MPPTPSQIAHPLRVLSSLSPRQHPHEEELHNVGVEEEELGSLVALRPRVGLHGGSRAAGVFG